MSPLHPHPAHPAPPLRVEASAARGPDGLLRVRFRLTGDIARLRVPAGGPPAFTTGLWHHTCCEAFVAREDDATYHEINCAPSGAWAAFAFRGHRDGGPVDDARLRPAIDVARHDDALTLDVRLPLAALSPAHPTAALRLGLSAVIEDDGGALSYWALRHPPGPPDFHHRDAFALRLAGGEGPCEALPS